MLTAALVAFGCGDEQAQNGGGQPIADDASPNVLAGEEAENEARSVGARAIPIAITGRGDTGVTLDDLSTADLPFDVLLPDDPRANDSNVSGVRIGPRAIDAGTAEDGDGRPLRAASLVLTYPPATEGAKDLDQPFTSISESKWDGGDPQEAFEADLAREHPAGEDLCEVASVPALCVASRSPASAGRTNPALVRFVSGDTEVVVFGGESLDALLAIAESLRPISVVS